MNRELISVIDEIGRQKGIDKTRVIGAIESALQTAWLMLERTQRSLLALRAEGYGMSEISAITGIPHDALGARLHRARRSLRRHLDRELVEGDSPPRKRNQS